jgi:cytoskeletal protein RodZ
MALSQDEQRVLAEIERRLVAEDPRLASSLSTFRRPGAGSLLRSPRARVIGTLFTVLVVAMVSLMVYAMIPFRAHGTRTPASPSAASQTRATTTTLSASGSTNPQQATQQVTNSASGGVAGSTSMGAPNSSAAPSSRAPSPRTHGTAPSQASQAVQATGLSAPSTHGP